MIYFDAAGLAAALAGRSRARQDAEHHRWLMSLPDEPVTLRRENGSTYETSLRRLMVERDAEWRREERAREERERDRQATEKLAAALQSYAVALRDVAAARDRESPRELFQ